MKNSVYYSMHYWTRVKLLLAVNLLVWMMQFLIHSVYPMQNVHVMKRYHQKKRSSKFWQRGYQDAVLVPFTKTPPNINTAIHTGEQISFPSSIKRKGSAKRLGSSFGVTYRKVRDVWMKRRSLKAKNDYSFWSSAKHRKGLKKSMILSSLPFRSG